MPHPASPVVALLLSLLPLQMPGGTPTQPQSQPQPSAGMSATHLDALHLSYSVPAGYIDATAMVGPAFEASVGHNPASAPIARCLSLPLSRMEPGGKQIGMVLLVRADSSCFKRRFDAGSVTELAQGQAQGLVAAGAKTNMGSPVRYTVAGRPAALVQGSFTLPTGQTLQSLVACVLNQPDVVCWQFLSDKAPALATMSAFPVTFDGTAATPLVPSEVLSTH